MKNKKIKLVKKSNTFLLKVWCSEEYFNHCDYAIFELTDKAKKEINAMKSTMTLCLGRNQRDKDAPTSLYKMTYWTTMSCGAHFVHNNDIPTAVLNAMDKSGDEINFLNEKPKSEHRLMVETSMMHIYEEGIRFETFIKDSNVMLETVTIPFETLGL